MLSRNDMTVLMQQVDVGKALDLLRHTTFGIEPTRRPARGMPVDLRTDGLCYGTDSRALTVIRR